MIGVSCLEKTWPTLITCEGRCRSFVSWRYDVSLRVLDGITRFRSRQRGQLLAGPGSEVCFGGYWWSLTSSEQVLWKLPPKPGYYHSLARQPVLPGLFLTSCWELPTLSWIPSHAKTATRYKMDRENFDWSTEVRCLDGMHWLQNSK